MAYQFSNAAREISAVKLISARSLLMVLASAVDKKTGTCFHSAGCLMHWSGLSKGTFYTAVAELEKHGILKRQRRRKGNHTNLWTLDIKKMESLRVSWQDIKPQDAVDTEDVNDDSGQGLPNDRPDEAEMGTWANEQNRTYEHEIGTEGYWTLSKVQEIVDKAGSDFERVKVVVETLTAAAWAGKIDTFFSKMKAARRQRMGASYFQKYWPQSSEAYDKVMTPTVSQGFYLEE